MWFKSQKFNENSDDFKNMCKLICSLNTDNIYDWSLGRIVDWKYGLWNEIKQEDIFFEKSTTLWYSFLDELAGFIISENGYSELQYVLNPKYHFLYDGMIASTIEKYDSIETVCNSEDKIKIEYLLKH